MHQEILRFNALKTRNDRWNWHAWLKPVSMHVFRIGMDLGNMDFGGFTIAVEN